MPHAFNTLRCSFLLALSLGLWALSAHAGIAVAPLKQELSVKPGESAKCTVNLIYNSRDPNERAQGVRISLADVQVSEDGALAFPAAGSQANSAAKWLTISHAAASLEPGQTLPVEITAAPPANIPPGEYYATVLVTLVKTGLTDKGLSVQYRVASGVFVTVLGQSLNHQAKIGRCELQWPAPAASQPTTAPATQRAEPEQPRIAVVLQNTGHARFDGSGKVAFIDAKSRIALVSTFTSRRPCVFAGDSRLFEAYITKPLPAGGYRVKVEMDYQSPWSKARQEIAVEITPEQAAQLLAIRSHHQEEDGGLEVAPEKLAPTIPAGATRSLALTLRNVSDAPLHCQTSSSAAAGPNWLAVSPAEFTITRSGRQSVEVKIQIPADARAGAYTATVNLATTPEGAPPRTLQIPVEVQVKGVGP